MQATRTTIQTPPILRWAGSKRKILRSLQSFWSDRFNRYLEPFAGSAALFFYIQPKQALLNDTNEHLIETYRALSKNPNRLHECVAALPRTAENYYFVRSLDPRGLTQIQRAVRFLYLNRNCFNGLYRTNQDGKFNVPFSGSRVGNLPSKDSFVHAAKLLRRSTLYSIDFEEFIWATVKKGDFVYLDPPYAVTDRRIFREYSPLSFSVDDLYRLKETLSEIESRGAHFILTYAFSKDSHKLFSSWNHQSLFVRRQISGSASDRSLAQEKIYTNLC